MKKFFLFIFTLFSGLIFFQLILSKNGLIEGIRTQKEKQMALYYKSLLERQRDELSDYIKYLKDHPNALNDFAEKLGFYKDDYKFIKIIDEIDLYAKNENSLDEVNKIFNEYKKKNNYNEKIDRIKFYLNLFFFLFFGFFIFIVIFGIKKKDE
ncbi:MAG: hypothetical protein JXB50_03810 [Spirochaetes bacterium]|nr:hypothetical protein [Spirochaetota bacterium]